MKPDDEEAYKALERFGGPSTRANDGFRLVRLSQVAPEAVAWLWPGRIPRGKVTLLEGDPGLGKTTLLCDLAAAVSAGRGIAGGPVSPPANVILLTGEDGLADTIRPRLDSAGADSERVFAWESHSVAGNGGRLISLPEDTQRLASEVNQTKAALVLIDVLDAFLSNSVDSYKNHDVRRALTPLAQLADTTGAAIVAVRHLRKGASARAVHSGQGSIGIIGAARAALLLEQDPDDPEGRILAVVKCNVGRAGPSLGFKIESSPDGTAPRLAWTGERPYSADDLTARRGLKEPWGRPPALSEGAAFLSAHLATGPALKSELCCLAEAEGLTPRTLERAAREIGVQSHKDGFGRGTTWSLTNEHQPRQGQ